MLTPVNGKHAIRWLLGGIAGPPEDYDPTSVNVLVVYKRPDGAWDFAIPLGNGWPSAGAMLVETSGRVYAFFLESSGRATVTFTSQE